MADATVPTGSSGAGDQNNNGVDDLSRGMGKMNVNDSRGPPRGGNYDSFGGGRGYNDRRGYIVLKKSQN